MELSKYKPLKFKNRIAFTHKNCSDGLMSAYVLEKAFGSGISVYYVTHNDLEFVDSLLCSYVNDSEEAGDTEVFFVDITFSEALHLKVDSSFGRQIIVDHHITAKDRLESIVNHFVFDLNMSAANIAYHYFTDLVFGKIDYRHIKILEAVNRVDLGDFTCELDLDLYAMLELCSNTKQLEDMLDEIIRDECSILDCGHWINRSKNKKAEMIARNAHEICLCGEFGMAVNSPAYVMEITNILLRKFPKAPFVACYWRKNGYNDDEVQFSLRSEEHRGCDVSDIASSLGGGGHKCAAGFTTDSLVEYIEL